MLQDHVANHAFPTNVATCGPCKFWKNRWTWSAHFSCLNPVSKKKQTWLGCKNGFAICTICAEFDEYAGQTLFGQGVGSLLKKANITRHSQSAVHKSAQLAWEQRLRAEATQVEIVSVDTTGSAVASATSTSARAASAVSTRTRKPTEGYRAIVAARVLLETAGSFNSVDKWFNSVLGEDRQALESTWHCQRLVSTMALQERSLTQLLLREGAVFRLEADGLERAYQVEIGAALWPLLACLLHLLNHGQPEGWLQELGPRGHLVIERTIGTH